MTPRKAASSLPARLWHPGCHCLKALLFLSCGVEVEDLPANMSRGICTRAKLTPSLLSAQAHRRWGRHIRLQIPGPALSGIPEAQHTRASEIRMETASIGHWMWLGHVSILVEWRGCELESCTKGVSTQTASELGMGRTSAKAGGS